LRFVTLCFCKSIAIVLDDNDDCDDDWDDDDCVRVGVGDDVLPFFVFPACALAASDSS